MESSKRNAIETNEWWYRGCFNFSCLISSGLDNYFSFFPFFPIAFSKIPLSVAPDFVAPSPNLAISDFSSSICSIKPVKDENGPSQTFTFSPISKLIPVFWLSALSDTCPNILLISLSEIGVGLSEEPKNPLTFGRFLIRW